VALSEVEFVVVASDGLWDVLSDAECCGLVRSFTSTNVAAELSSVARRRGSHDDIAVVVGRIQNEARLSAVGA